MGILKEIPVEQEQNDIKVHVESYWTKRADGFMELREAELKSNKYERWEKEILNQLKPYQKDTKKETLKILDVGCGCGFFGIMLSKHGHEVTGVDLTPAMIDCGKKLADQYQSRVELLVMDAEQLSFADESFDVVISRNLTWTLPHGMEAYKEWKRVLKKDGLLLNYDAEYAKDYHKKEELPKDHAHHDIPLELEQECHKIYHMLSASNLKRPDWDKEVLTALGMKRVEIEENIGKDIYIEQDRFFVPDEIFRIKAFK